MIYLKIFVIYSILGFLFESLIYKYNNINKHSGVLTGPYTLVYGTGGTLCFFLNNYLSCIKSTLLNNIISYITYTIICALMELIIGHLIHFLYKIDSWNYTYKKYHLGKYITLDYAFIWGFLSLFLVKKLNNFFFNITLLISNKFTTITLVIIVFDILYTYKKT